MKILLYNPDNGVKRNFMPHLWMFLLAVANAARIRSRADRWERTVHGRREQYVRDEGIGLVGIGAMTRMGLGCRHKPQGSADLALLYGLASSNEVLKLRLRLATAKIWRFGGTQPSAWGSADDSFSVLAPGSQRAGGISQHGSGMLTEESARA
jgi:hypothetical protein